MPFHSRRQEYPGKFNAMYLMLNSVKYQRINSLQVTKPPKAIQSLQKSAQSPSIFAQRAFALTNRRYVCSTRPSISLGPCLMCQFLLSNLYILYPLGNCFRKIAVLTSEAIRAIGISPPLSFES